jgi:hypothetical protein
MGGSDRSPPSGTRDLGRRGAYTLLRRSIMMAITTSRITTITPTLMNMG